MLQVRAIRYTDTEIQIRETKGKKTITITKQIIFAWFNYKIFLFFFALAFQLSMSFSLVIVYAYIFMRIMWHIFSCNFDFAMIIVQNKKKIKNQKDRNHANRKRKNKKIKENR